MENFLGVILLASLPAAGNFMEGLLSGTVSISHKTLSLALLAAVGILFAVIGIDLMAAALSVEPALLVILAFVTREHDMIQAIKWIIGAAAVLIALLLIWGIFIEPYMIDVEYETAEIPNLPANWQGKQIGVISDFQVGMWGDNEAAVGKAVNRLIELRPTVILFLGDFIYHAPSDEQEVERVIGLLQPLAKHEIPMFAVLGNHDYHVNDLGETPNTQLAGRLEQRLESIGVRVLHNEVVELPQQQAENTPLYLVGIDAYQPKLGSSTKAFSSLNLDKPRFVMMHNPASFETVPAGAAPVAVAGHTHGGQVRIPFTPEWSYLTYLKEEPVHADGWIANYGKENNRLYVNRGIGFSKFPIRINCIPEVTLFTLKNPS